MFSNKVPQFKERNGPKPMNVNASIIRTEQSFSICLKRFNLILNDLMNNYLTNSQIDPNIVNCLFEVIQCFRQSPYKILSLLSQKENIEMVYRVFPLYC